MKFKAFFLKFETPLHLGDYKPESYETSESFLRSDTIAAAIISAWAQIGNDAWINEGNLPFTLSSGFPFYCNDNNYNLFFPRPKLPFVLSDRDTKLSKAIKKISWLDQSYFEKVIAGIDISSTLEQHIRGEFLSEIVLPEDGFMTKQVSERVKIPRERSEDNQSEPFYMERLYFKDAGLYFLANGDHLDRITEALNFLQYEGFGTDRNVGNGFFTFSSEEINLTLPEDKGYSISLGLYCPESEDNVKDEIDDHASYDLIRRGGWITTPGYQSLEKNSIYMFTEGSVFHKPAGVSGKASIDLKPKLPDTMLPEHGIYRCGKTIFIPVNI